MGCLIEFLFEFIFENIGFLLELIFDSIIEFWLMLMQLILPKVMLSKRLRFALKIIIIIFSVLLLVIMFIGIVAVISDDPDVKRIGMFMIFVPLGISTVQIAAGIIIRFVSRRKK